MSQVNLIAREIAAKIVYYGCGLSGKTTSLKRVFETIRPTHRGDMISLATEGDRTLFFDFLPVKVERVRDLTVRLALYTVPGQVFYNSTRKLVLQGADGVVFVADSQPSALDSNREALENLTENLLELGLNPKTFPLVIQYNKRDLKNALPVSELRSYLNPSGVPELETCAETGQGVLDALKTITRLVIRDLKARGIVSPRPKRAAPAVEETKGPSMMDSLSEKLAELREAPEEETDEAVAEAEADRGGYLSALAPLVLRREALEAERAFAKADYPGAVAVAAQAVHRALEGVKGTNAAERALLLGLSGPDYFRFFTIASGGTPKRQDAAFALFFMAALGARLSERR